MNPPSRIPSACIVAILLAGCAASSGPSVVQDTGVDAAVDTGWDTAVDTGLPDLVDTAPEMTLDTACPPGLTNCGEACVDVLTDVYNCGTCGNVCPGGGEHTVTVCVGGICGSECEPGWVDNDGLPGCETPCPSGTEEFCNGIDDDCDTVPDQVFDCVMGTVLDCTTTCGSLGSGTCSLTCTLPTPETCTPPAEACNGIDDDCDTLVDEDWPPGTCGPCTPDCTGRDCGDDGCGGSCGTCTPPQVCNDYGACITTCTPDCVGRVCGDDGCGGSCGTCTAPLVCDAAGQCVTTCTPDCTGRDCGDDGCGGSCGTCTSPLTCNALGVCVCIPDCGTRVCGPDPVCGLSCGSCSPPDTCDAWGTCTCIPNCTGRDCGLDPTCGTSCGTCTAPATCDGFGHCTCTPDCSGLECGPDPICGTTCGSCSPPSDTCLDTVTLRDYTGSTCVSGTCNPAYSDTICPVACIVDECVDCLIDTDCPSGYECTATYECIPSGCPPPTGSCTTGSEDRSSCSGARTIGRTQAGISGGYSISDTTCYADTEFDDCSWDAGADHAYRLYMLAGEQVSIYVYASWACSWYSSSWWDLTLRIFGNSGCSDTACTTSYLCEDHIGSHTEYFTAPHDGWFIFVVDGSTAFDDEGDYDMTVTLTCNDTSTCGC